MVIASSGHADLPKFYYSSKPHIRQLSQWPALLPQSKPVMFRKAFLTYLYFGCNAHCLQMVPVTMAIEPVSHCINIAFTAIRDAESRLAVVQKLENDWPDQPIVSGDQSYFVTRGIFRIRRCSLYDGVVSQASGLRCERIDRY